MIYVVGYGNLGWALNALFTAHHLNVTLVSDGLNSNATTLSFHQFYQTTLPDGALVFLCVPDAHIATIAAKIQVSNVHVIHCSGATDISALAPHPSAGIFYPLHSFTKGNAVNWNEVQLCLEANNPELQNKLTAICQQLSLSYQNVNSAQRLKVHLAAVFASNFTMANLVIAQQLLTELGLPENFLNSLAINTMEKLRHIPASDALTGPAKRGDENTLQKHLEILATQPRLKELYQLMTKVIQDSRD